MDEFSIPLNDPRVLNEFYVVSSTQGFRISKTNQLKLMQHEPVMSIVPIQLDQSVLEFIKENARDRELWNLL